MSRKFWGGMMFTSLLVTGGAGFFLCSQIEKLSSVSTPPIAPTRPLTHSAPKPNPPDPVAEPQATAPATNSAASSASTEQTRNILFRFTKSAAKSVFIVGDFNDWHRQPLAKKGKAWEISLSLAPGSYKYQFVVDEKHVRDPNNKNVSEGKSVISVKTLTNKN